MDAVSTILDLPLDLTNEYLQTHANVDALTDQHQKTYQYIRRSVKPSGFLIYEKLALKLYYMIRETEPLPQNLQENLYVFIDGEIEQERLDTKQGIGFAILSQGFLSINIWGRGNVLFTQTYTVEGSFPELSAKSLEETGVACTWEIRIMNYEYNLWHRYLETEMTVIDKKKYLQTFIVGNLW
jgi:hypothetical protein